MGVGDRFMGEGFMGEGFITLVQFHLIPNLFMIKELENSH